jgi:hypothetical protein
MLWAMNGRILLLVLALASAPLAHAEDAAVRRFEWVLMVRTSSEFPDAVARAGIAAGRAGGAVLEDIRMDAAGQYSDYRLLIRTIDRDAIGPILARVRATSGVMGATVAPLPETPTWAGGPGFMESYTVPDDRPTSNVDRVIMRHDVPPIGDKRELLEVADVVVGPGLPPVESLGGFTLNVSELLQRLKQSSWRRREDGLRQTPIIILPPDGSPVPDLPSDPSH